MPLVLRVLCFALIALLLPRSTEAATPAGKVAYVWQAKLWVYDLATGARRPLVDGPAVAPQWSSSGHYLSLWNGPRVLILSADGDLRRTLPTAETAPAWAPQRDKLAYWAAGGKLQIESPMGEEVRPVQTSTERHYSAPLWSPDGQYLAYADVQRRPPEARAKLFRVSAKGGQPEDLGKELLACVDLAGWPTADAILLWPNPECSASIAADGLELQRLSVPQSTIRPLGLTTLLHPPAIARSGDAAVTAGAGRTSWLGKQIVVIKANGQVTPPVSPPGHAGIQPAWSPDGGRLAWSGMAERPSSWQEAERFRRLWIAPLSGGPPGQVTHDPAFQDEAPVWTADGNHLLFVRLDAKGRAGLWLLDLDRKAPTKIADLDSVGDYYGWRCWAQVFAYSPR